MYNLVIVESPAKAKTIESYLGEDYKVVSSVGHVRDLAKSGPGGLGIDIEEDFKANYTYIRGKKKVVNEIVKLAKKADNIYIATDPDREGEAIGWHLLDILELDEEGMNRVVFSEITKNGVLNGIANVRSLDMDLVNSQEGRRKIDRIMGFKLSKLLQKKIRAKSAGRVQSVALLMIVIREKEILAFIPVEYWKMFASVDEKLLDYVHNNDKVVKEEIDVLYDKLLSSNNTLTVSDIKTRKRELKPKKVYTTSTFQQDAINRLGYNAKRTMMIAQRLYEGVEVAGELTGLITYMRTDSTRLSEDFVSDAKTYIDKEYGADYLGNYKQAKSKNAQDAHEGIRPTNLKYSPKRLKNILDEEQLKVYTLIWNRTIAALMSNAKTTSYTYILSSDVNVDFKTTNTIVDFDGFRKLYVEEIEDENEKFNYELGSVIEGVVFSKTQHFTQPKPRYTEASLIKELEENGVGRPSTYASIIDTLKTRNYVEVDQRRFKPTEDGTVVVKTLEDYFSDVINIEYTSKLEQDLDEIAIGEKTQVELLNKFYNDFDKLITNAYETMPEYVPEKTGNKCPKCGHDLVKRKGRFGEFEGCSNFPECRYIVVEQQESLADCPKCSGHVVEKKTRRGKVFYGCDNYPDCDFAVWNLDDLKKDNNDNA